MGISHVETHPSPKKILCRRGCPQDLSSIAWLFSGPQAKDVRERASLKRNLPFLMGKSPLLMGKSPFLMGKSPFLMGKSPFLMGKSPFLMGKSQFLMGKSIITMENPRLLLVRFTQGMDGLLGVAGMMTLIVSQWIIPENSLRLAPVRKAGRDFEGTCPTLESPECGTV